MPPAGSLKRTRLYVPARALWGALTAELSRHEAEGKEPQYQTVGESLQDGYRFSYLFPAEESGGTWKVWLPTYRGALGLGWHHEDRHESVVSDRQFRRRFISTRPGTSIDPTTDAADDGSLRETECIEMRWRKEHGRDAGTVAMVGYVFIRTTKAKDKYATGRRRLDDVDTLFIGGDGRYGLGRIRRVSLEMVKSAMIFGVPATLDSAAPQIVTGSVFAHAVTDNAEPAMAGALELLGGWDRGSVRRLDQGSPLWQPGSYSHGAAKWTVEPEGTWRSMAMC
jgi:hypothetical protein